ncbi:hypothetical protein DS893_18855 [Vibrionales bacterium C3R12]|nr:hypothetical protein DS893_18855 [Vibrionales bacterium C3R12]
MKWKDSELVSPISLGMIEDQKSYWANHFFSILQCLDSHKNFKYSPRQLNTYPNWSLNQIRGQLPFNFFGEIQDFMANWGFQYFLVNYLNLKASSDLVDELITRLSDMYDASFSASLNEYSFHISGADSTLSSTLRSRFTDVFPQEIRENPPRVSKLINDSDICLIIHDDQSESEKPYRVGIFGEVEGKHGNKMRRDSYWKKKSDFCVFSFGVMDGDEKGCYVENTYLDGVDRVSFHFEQEHYVVSDFRYTLRIIESLFLHGPHYRTLIRDDELKFFVNMVKQYWNRPISDLLHELSRFIDGTDLVGQREEKKIQIITDIQS